MGIERYLVLSAVLFTIGLYGALSRRNIIVVIMSIEIMFNAVNVAFVAMARYVNPAVLRLGGDVSSEKVQWILTGQAFAVFVVVVAAAEVALGLALIIALFRHRDSVDITEVNLLKR